ncbi:acyl-coa synthetase [Dermatophagoides farinae]|uniref:Medium-chain acyl-CoA ligase ACSF2, mitochondrial n=1 Tax=Dermatophagoides farinae TaxID=6954 RepID=A0A9D4NZF4_DERFA|nr:putative acyl-CoA synthetase YngI [Dermatophagoides farinae]KAH7640340.1 acyl-coa synthetase [Dermatophagoides farinae]
MLKFITSAANHGHCYLFGVLTNRFNTRINTFGLRSCRFIASMVQDLNDSNLSYVHGCPPTPIATYSPLTIGELLKRSVAIDPDRIGFIVAHQNISKTYSQFDADVDRLAKALRSLGCRRGSVVGLWAVNCYEWLLIQFATAKLGAIMVAINPAYKERELLNVFRLIGIETMIMNQQFRYSDYGKVMENIAPGIFASAQHGSARVHSEQLPQLKNLIVIDQTDGETVPLNVCRFSQLMQSSFPEKDTHKSDENNDTQFDDVINVQFTSGTTGLPKGSMLTHFNIIQNGQFIAPILFEDLNEPPTVCIPNPLYHAFGCVVGTVASVFMHGTLVLPGPIFNADTTIQSIEKYGCDYLYGTPTMWSDLLQRPLHQYNLTTLKRGVMSGAPCPSVLLHKIRQTIPSLQNILIPYGSTEIGPVATCTRINDSEAHKFESVGLPIPYVEVKVTDIKSNRTVRRGERGEVLVRSHGTFPGYMNQPDKTDEVIDDNFWYHTGDVGWMDQQGYLHISGRIKEMIIRGGENIYPKEVEELIMQMTGESIEDVHVVGIADTRLGEEMVAFIKLRSGKTNEWTEKSLKDHLRNKMSHFKVPKHIHFIDDFPRTPTGKIRKIDLKQMATQMFATESDQKKA